MDEHLDKLAEQASNLRDAAQSLQLLSENMDQALYEITELQQMELATVYEDERWEIRVCLCNEQCRLCAIDKTKDEEHPNYWLSASDIADALSSAKPEGWRN